ncbi:hypothetical protein M0Q97_05755 [Candidatus Dojkabacteria bacterium]|jgi:hypothetical protein|nr:hypothetical protein [Candidatus Dojkabacteria bacterium]
MATKADKEEFQESIERLKNEIVETQDELDFNPSDFFPDTQNVDLNLKIEMHDYEKDLEIIRAESKETLDCLANLYLNEDTMTNKNIKNIITQDALALSDLKFSISCSKRGLINLMKQIDNGSTDAELFQAVSMFQREMKEGINMLYKLQKDMKEFFKDLKGELKEINIGNDVEIQDKYKGLRITDRDINKSLDKILKDKKG